MGKRDVSRAAWSRAMEARALRMPAAALDAATQNWQSLPTQGEQLMLARETASARSSELTLAYRNVVHVTSGFRKKRLRSGKDKLLGEPCIVFIVRRKWAKGKAIADKRQCLPKHLLAWASIGDRRELCAVPTDVQAEVDLFHVRPRAASLGWTDEPSFPEMGNIACMLRVRHAAGVDRLVLSALHVFSPKPQVGPPSLAKGLAHKPTSPLGQRLAAPVVARTLDYGGVLRDAQTGLPSFDVQLARIESLPDVRRVLEDLPLSGTLPYIRDAAIFEKLGSEKYFDLAVPQNHPALKGAPRPRMLCEFSRWLDRTPSIPYNARRGASQVSCEAVHKLLVEMKVVGKHVPLGGDSGCALVLYLGDGSCSLAGMFIASHDELPYAYVIPAWEIMDPSNYWNLPAGASLVPANP